MDDQEFSELFRALFYAYPFPSEDFEKMLPAILSQLAATPPKEDDDDKSSQDTLE